jgi:hypothetical protein
MPTHQNESPADPRFGALARVLAADGCRISIGRQEFVPELLQTAQVLVVSDALGLTGWLGRFGVHMRANAFHADEVDAVRDWVSAGGSAVDAAGPLASALGVSIADRAYRQLGRSRVAVIATQLADPHNRAIEGRDTMLGILHWLSHAESFHPRNRPISPPL